MQVESWGNKQNTEYRIECNVCGCKFRFKRSEILDEKDWDKEDWFVIKPNNYIKCPQCNTKRYFYGSDLRGYQMTKFDKFITLIKDGFKTSMTYMFRREKHE